MLASQYRNIFSYQTIGVYKTICINNYNYNLNNDKLEDTTLIDKQQANDKDSMLETNNVGMDKKQNQRQLNTVDEQLMYDIINQVQNDNNININNEIDNKNNYIFGALQHGLSKLPKFRPALGWNRTDIQHLKNNEKQRSRLDTISSNSSDESMSSAISKARSATFPMSLLHTGNKKQLPDNTDYHYQLMTN